MNRKGKIMKEIYVGGIASGKATLMKYYEENKSLKRTRVYLLLVIITLIVCNIALAKNMADLKKEVNAPKQQKVIDNKKPTKVLNGKNLYSFTLVDVPEID